MVWIAATLGLVSASVLDRFLDGDSDDSDSGGAGGMDGGMGGDDDLFGGGGGGAGGGGEFDEFDGMDEWDDTFEGDEGGGTDTDELEKRIDDLEAEVASLSSTVSTVRSENEEISGTVEEIEEDVRNLLDIYEMVTRGINPFVDESSGFDEVAGGGEGSFGLFDDEADDETEDLDEDVANADPDGFFDEELVEPEAEDDLGESDDFGELDGLDGETESADEPGDEDDGDAADAASATESADEGDDMNDDGKSFSELKEEYDAGEADWADDGGETDADAAADEDSFDDGADTFDDGADSFDDGADSFDDGDDPFEEGGFDDPSASLGDGFDEEGDSFDDGGFDEDPPSSEPAAADPEPARTSEPARASEPGGDPAEANGDGFEYVTEGDLSGRRGKPYLTELPADYVGDLLVMEWLEFLVSASDVTDAVRAINYYQRIEWIGPDAADRLRDFLSGFGTIDRNVVDRPGTERLVREHHTRSLRYITQLNGTSSHTVLLDRWDDLTGGSLVGGSPPPTPRCRNRRQTSEERDRHRTTHDGASHDEARSHDGRDRSVDRGDNGASPRPMNDPNPRSDRGDPADGGWGDGR